MVISRCALQMGKKKSSCFQLFHHGSMKEALGKIMENWRVACVTLLQGGILTILHGDKQLRNVKDGYLLMPVPGGFCHPTPFPQNPQNPPPVWQRLEKLWWCQRCGFSSLQNSRGARVDGGELEAVSLLRICNSVCRCYDYMFNGNMLVCFVDVKSLCFRSRRG